VCLYLWAQVMKLRDQPCVFNLYMIMQSDCLYVKSVCVCVCVQTGVCGGTKDRSVVKAPVWSHASNLTSYEGWGAFLW